MQDQRNLSQPITMRLPQEGLSEIEQVRKQMTDGEAYDLDDVLTEVDDIVTGAAA